MGYFSRSILYILAIVDDGIDLIIVILYYGKPYYYHCYPIASSDKSRNNELEYQVRWFSKLLLILIICSNIWIDIQSFMGTLFVILDIGQVLFLLNLGLFLRKMGICYFCCKSQSNLQYLLWITIIIGFLDRRFQLFAIWSTRPWELIISYRIRGRLLYWLGWLCNVVLHQKAIAYVGHGYWSNSIEYHVFLEGLLEITDNDELRIDWQKV